MEPLHGRAKAERPGRTYIQQLSEDTGCSPKDLPEAMNDREEWREGIRDIHVSGTTRWWWWVITWKSDLSGEIKREFFQVVAVSVLLYQCTTLTLMNRFDIKLDENYTLFVLSRNTSKTLLLMLNRNTWIHLIRRKQANNIKQNY